jgi:cyclopropane fatty-acyl-phospholipid synthase-like methyltransferase
MKAFEYYKTKDQCRQGLLLYLEKAVSIIPGSAFYHILDIGCGTGVPSMFLAGHFKSSLTAIDTDKSALAFFQKKVKEANFSDRIIIQNVSFFDFAAEKESFDLIVAEGLLNITGFEEGFVKAIEWLKPGAYFIIHDEFKDHDIKLRFMASHHCTLANTLYLDENIWWNCYYDSLNKHIMKIADNETLKIFDGDRKEISQYKIEPQQFRSIYYIVQKKK